MSFALKGKLFSSQLLKLLFAKKIWGGLLLCEGSQIFIGVDKFNLITKYQSRICWLGGASNGKSNSNISDCSENLTDDLEFKF